VAVTLKVHQVRNHRHPRSRSRIWSGRCAGRAASRRAKPTFCEIVRNVVKSAVTSRARHAAARPRPLRIDSGSSDRTVILKLDGRGRLPFNVPGRADPTPGKGSAETWPWSNLFASSTVINNIVMFIYKYIRIGPAPRRLPGRVGLCGPGLRRLTGPSVNCSSSRPARTRH